MGDAWLAGRPTGNEENRRGGKSAASQQASPWVVFTLMACVHSRAREGW